MIPGAAYMGLNAARRKRSLLSIIQSAGLTTNLKLCLDAGDRDSYDGSSQTWVDRSGTATNFYRGTGSGSDTTDPTFNGVAGGLSASEYWSFDGGDYFTPVAGANPSWIEPFHKDGATLTILCGAYGAIKVCADGNIVSPGFEYAAGSGAMQFIQRNGGGGAAFTPTLLIPSSQWFIAGISISENGGAAGGTHLLNGSTETFNPAYSAPSASSAGITIKIGATASPTASDTRLGWLAMWDVALTASQMQQIYSVMQGRR